MASFSHEYTQYRDGFDTVHHIASYIKSFKWEKFCRLPS